MTELERKIEYSFKNPRLLETALTHSSYANEKHTESYERLEFLGDAILDFVAGEKLFIEQPGCPEGMLTKKRADMVCEAALHEAAKKLNLGAYLRISKGEEKTGGRERASVLADIIESVTAAIYLDSDFSEAKRFLEKYVLSCNHHESDSKSALQELVQKDGAAEIIYEELSESGPDHRKSFEFCVKVNGTELGRGTGRSKQEAQQSAAAAALEELRK